MLEGITAKFLDIVKNWSIGKLKARALSDDRVVKILKRTRFISQIPEPNFESTYNYALVEYSTNRPSTFIGFFRYPFVKSAFEKGVNQGDFAPVYTEALNLPEDSSLAQQLKKKRFEPQREIQEFVNIFNRLISQTRTPEEVKQDEALAHLTQGQIQNTAKLDQISESVNTQKILVLDFEWFKARFEKQIVSLRDKFNPVLHTTTDIDYHVHAILCDEAQLKYLDQLLSELIENLKQFNNSVHVLSEPTPHLIVWGNTRDGLIEDAQNIDKAVRIIVGQFQKAQSELKYSRYEYVQNAQWENILGELTTAIDAYSSRADQINPSTLPCQGDDDTRRRAFREAEEQIHDPVWQAQSFLEKALHIVDQLDCLKQSTLHIFGEAGIGKTHLSAHICSERIEQGLPALLLLGRQFTSDSPIEDQLRQILDIPPVFSWHDCLKALSASANEHHTRMPIIIDGLNEATFHGAFSNIWRLGLPGFSQEIAAFQNIILITTCREAYKNVVWPDGIREPIVTAHGFDEYSVEEAIEKYFAWYKIRADITAISMAQFEYPIYLQIFCASKNLARQEEVHVYIGQESIFSVYDEYLSQVNHNICERLRLYPRSQVLIPALMRLGEYLWSKFSRGIPINDAVQLIDGVSRDHLVWEDSRTWAIEAEGLLVYRDWGNNQERLYFTHDLLAGYIIAQYLIEQAHEDYSAYFNSADLIKSLFSEDYQQSHPLHEDICRCLAALLPVRTGTYLHELVDMPTAFDASIKALFEIQPDAIKENAVELVRDLFARPENRIYLFDFLPFTLGHVGHPLNATFWTQLLTPLTVVDRDITWTEYIRQNEDTFEKIISHLESTCKHQGDLSELLISHIYLYAEGVMWTLTSTVRPLRDKATLALYWFGRRFPEILLQLTEKSFTLNDPYIRERMLAAIYGVAMARQNDFVERSFPEEILPLYGHQLFDAIFCIEAPFATTHILARDYAMRTIQIAQNHHKNLLAEEEQQRINPPFQDGGIRKWGQRNLDDQNTEPIRLDFGNYTVGRLVRNRSNYDFENPDYKVVLSNLYWRIFDLGYKEDIFGEIDQEIYQGNSWHRKHNDDAGKTDRYGKKYSWIAYFELAGFYQDLGLLGETSETPRLPGVDIDPSFPNEPSNFELVKNDFLGDRRRPREDWIQNGSTPDLSPYLIVQDLCGEAGEWVLLDGYLNQEDHDYQRKLFVFPRGLLVKYDSLDELTSVLQTQEFGDTRLPGIPEDYYTYAGEIPWADTYPYNGSEIFEFQVGESEQDETEERIILIRDGVPLSEDEMSEFLGQFVSLANEHREDRQEPTLREFANQMDLEIKVETEPTTVRTPEYQDFEVEIPIREHCWESYHSKTNPGQRVAVLSKEIAEHLRLCNQPQTYDLFDETGQRASIVFRFGEHWHTFQSFIYIRKDLLDKYLSETGTRLLWAVWGERTIMESGIQARSNDIRYKVFQQILLYDQMQ